MSSYHPEARKNIRKSIADFLFDIGDLNRSKLEWAGKVPGVMRLFVEDVEGFFTDCLMQRDLEWNVKRGLLTQEEADILRPFYEAFRKFVDTTRDLKRPDTEIADDPRWKTVSTLAAETYLKLASQLRA